jgi:hypothetical protein
MRVGNQVQAHSFSPVGATYGYGRGESGDSEPILAQRSSRFFSRPMGYQSAASPSIRSDGTLVQQEQHFARNPNCIRQVACCLHSDIKSIVEH